MALAHQPFDAPYLLPLPLALVLWLVAREPTPRLAARAAFLSGVGFWTVHLFWLPQSFASFLGWPVWTFMPLLWLAEAGFWLLTAWAARTIGGRGLPGLGVFACALLVLEWLRGLGPLAFPWGDFGYALVDTPLAQVASLGGVHLLSGLVIVLAAGIAALAWREARLLLVAVALWLAAGVYGFVLPAPPEATETTVLAQANIDPRYRLLADRRDETAAYRALSTGQPSDALHVWPEAAVNRTDAATSGVARLVSGVYDYNTPSGVPANLVVSVADGKEVAWTPKQHLVPFGEYFPLRKELAIIYDPVFRMLGLPGYASATPSGITTILPNSRDVVGAYVCYDSVFADAARAYVRAGANVLVNVSNDGWFGNTWGVEQHFRMGRVRAIEQNRYLLRAGNTGITAVIDPRGAVRQRLDQGVRGVLVGQYAPVSGLTLYGRFGEWPVLVTIILGLIVAVAARRRRAGRRLL
jgi:apolipoprotein N-acyltransferase